MGGSVQRSVFEEVYYGELHMCAEVLFVFVGGFFQAEDGIRELGRARGRGEGYKRQGGGGGRAEGGIGKIARGGQAAQCAWRCSVCLCGGRVCVWRWGCMCVVVCLLFCLFVFVFCCFLSFCVVLCRFLSFVGGLSLHDCICVQKQDRYVPKAAQLPVFFSYACFMWFVCVEYACGGQHIEASCTRYTLNLLCYMSRP